MCVCACVCLCVCVCLFVPLALKEGAQRTKGVALRSWPRLTTQAWHNQTTPQQTQSRWPVATVKRERGSTNQCEVSRRERATTARRPQRVAVSHFFSFCGCMLCFSAAPSHVSHSFVQALFSAIQRAGAPRFFVDKNIEDLFGIAAGWETGTGSKRDTLREIDVEGGCWGLCHAQQHRCAAQATILWGYRGGKWA